MRYYNPLYTRKWTKIFVPISTFFLHLGRQLGFQRAGSTETELTTPLTNGHITNPSEGTSSFLSYLAKTNPFSSRKYLNGYAKETHENFVYHQLNLPTINDENNNNQSTTDSNQSSSHLLLHIPPNENLHYPDTRQTCYLTFKENFFWIALLTLIYFLWFILVAGISIVPILIYSALLLLYLFSDRTRRFAFAIIIYLTYVFLYDTLHLVPNYTISKVHIEDIYLIEKKLFGIYRQGHLITLNEYFQQNHIPVLDVLTGLCYLQWLPIPIAYSLYLYRYKSKRDYMDFAFTFLLTNILGFITYYIIPAAPPWYIEVHGFQFDLRARGNPAGFIHFDEQTGLKLFSSMYSKNANVFAAIPSLHAAYPLITVLYGSLSKKLWLHIAFVCFTLSVWFSAVYSRHHYVLDVLAGGLCAATAFLIYRLFSRVPLINRFLTAYSKLI